jgi:hypothetical protein
MPSRRRAASLRAGGVAPLSHRWGLASTGRVHAVVGPGIMSGFSRSFGQGLVLDGLRAGAKIPRHASTPLRVAQGRDAARDDGLGKRDTRHQGYVATLNGPSTLVCPMRGSGRPFPRPDGFPATPLRIARGCGILRCAQWCVQAVLSHTRPDGLLAPNASSQACFPPPRFSSLAAAGPFAFAQGDVVLCEGVRHIDVDGLPS